MKTSTHQTQTVTTFTRHRLARFSFFLALACLAPCLALSQTGIPEPGLILYGQVRNTAIGGTLLTYGTLRWSIQPPTGPPITVTTTLTNINDQFSYVTRVPFETVLPGYTLSANTLSLSNTPTTYTRSATVNLQPATIVAPALPSFTFSGGVAGDRGRTERVDLSVSLPLVDSDGDGMDDNWELAYFGDLSALGGEDSDHDGLSNLAEFKAGTNPKDPQSRFAFINIATDPLGGIDVQWSSVALHKYSVQRSGDLLGAFSNIQTNIDATPGTNYFRDAGATGVGPYFYRIRVE